MLDRSKILYNNYTTNSTKTQSFPSMRFPGDGDNASLSTVSDSKKIGKAAREKL